MRRLSSQAHPCAGASWNARAAPATVPHIHLLPAWPSAACTICNCLACLACRYHSALPRLPVPNWAPRCPRPTCASNMSEYDWLPCREWSVESSRTRPNEGCCTSRDAGTPPKDRSAVAAAAGHAEERQQGRGGQRGHWRDRQAGRPSRAGKQAGRPAGRQSKAGSEAGGRLAAGRRQPFHSPSLSISNRPSSSSPRRWKEENSTEPSLCPGCCSACCCCCCCCCCCTPSPAETSPLALQHDGAATGRRSGPAAVQRSFPFLPSLSSPLCLCIKSARHAHACKQAAAYPPTHPPELHLRHVPEQSERAFPSQALPAAGGGLPATRGGRGGRLSRLCGRVAIQRHGFNVSEQPEGVAAGDGVQGWGICGMGGGAEGEEGGQGRRRGARRLKSQRRGVQPASTTASPSGWGGKRRGGGCCTQSAGKARVLHTQAKRHPGGRPPRPPPTHQGRV